MVWAWAAMSHCDGAGILISQQSARGPGVHHRYNLGRAGVAVHFSRLDWPEPPPSSPPRQGPWPIEARAPSPAAAAWAADDLPARSAPRPRRRRPRRRRALLPRRRHGAVAVGPARPGHANMATAAVAGRQRAERRAPVPRRVPGDARGRFKMGKKTGAGRPKDGWCA